MITVQTERCDGCGVCVDYCPNGAILLQNGVAFISQDLCQACEACLDVCPQGALVYQEQMEPVVEVIHIPATPPAPVTAPAPATSLQTSVSRSGFWPAVGTFLLWTGRELGPRLAEIALNYLDQRVQATEPGVKVESLSYADQKPVNRGRGRRMRGRRMRVRQRGRR
jgi:NAD-dependent dihydropyrimidine dehydrogenase PreA subunit